MTATNLDKSTPEFTPEYAPIDWLKIDWEDHISRLLLYTSGRIDWLQWLNPDNEKLPEEGGEFALVHRAIEQTISGAQPWNPQANTLLEHLVGLIDESIDRLNQGPDPIETLPLKDIKKHLKELKLHARDLVDDIKALCENPAAAAGEIRADARPPRRRPSRQPLKAGFTTLASGAATFAAHARRLLSRLNERRRAAFAQDPERTVLNIRTAPAQRYLGRSLQTLRQTLVPLGGARYRRYRKPAAALALILVASLAMLPFISTDDESADRSQTVVLPSQTQADGAAQSAPQPVPAGSDKTAAELAKPIDINDSIRRGDTLNSILARHNVARIDWPQATAALVAAEGFGPRQLQPGQSIELVLSDARERRLETLRLSDRNYMVNIIRQADGSYTHSIENKTNERQIVQVEGRIESNFYSSANAAGVPTGSLLNLLNYLETAIDFRREVQPGDRFEIGYEANLDNAGQPISKGEIVSVMLHLQQKNATYRITYNPQDGTASGSGSPYRIERLPLAAP